MTAPDQTNAEVSDERLREALRWISEIATANFEQDDKLRSQGARTLKRIADKADDALDDLTRRSVTSQASEGEVVGWFWRWASSDEWRPLSRSGTEAGRADFVRDQEKIAPVVVAQLYLAPVSKRVERLETALKESRQWLQIVADEYEKASGEPQHIADTIARIDQALQGGRPS